MKIFIILPTYNEAENITRLIPELFALPLPGLHLLVVDDGSPDGTGKIAEALGEQYPGRIEVLHREGKLGLGSAYRLGFRAALERGADAIGQMDSDFSHPPDKLVELVAMLAERDVALGSRYVPGGAVDREWPMWRKALSSFGSFYARTILHLPIRDVTGGFKLWRRAAMAALPLDRVRSNGYVFQVEMSYIAHRLGFTFGEVPFYFAERQWGQSKMNFKIQIEAAVRTWYLLWVYRDLKPTRR